MATPDTAKVFVSTRTDTAERLAATSPAVAPGDWFVARGICQQARPDSSGAMAWHDADAAALPDTPVHVLLQADKPNTFITLDSEGKGKAITVEEVYTALSLGSLALENAVTVSQISDATVPGAALLTAASVRAQQAAIAGAAATDFTAASAGWTLNPGDSGRGVASRSGAGLQLAITSGGPIVPWDIDSGFHAPSATRTLPSGGARGVAIEMIFNDPDIIDSRTGIDVRNAAADFRVGISYQKNIGAVHFVELSPDYADFTDSGATVPGVRGLSLRLEGGVLSGYVTTTATPTEADWLMVGSVNLPATVAATRGKGVDTVELFHAVYASLASSVVITSAEVRALL